MSIGATTSSTSESRRTEDLERAREAAREGARRPISALLGEHACDIARRLAPGNASLQEHVAAFLRATHLDSFDRAGCFVGGDLAAPTLFQLDEFLAGGGGGAPGAGTGQVGSPAAAATGASGASRVIGASEAQQRAIDRVVTTYADFIEARTGSSELTRPLFPAGARARVEGLTEELHRLGGSIALGSFTATDPAAAELVAVLRTIDLTATPGGRGHGDRTTATMIATAVGEALCERSGAGRGSMARRSVMAVVVPAMTDPIHRVILSGPANQFAPSTPLRAETDAAAWLRTEVPRAAAAAAGSAPMREHLESRLREAVAMRDWLAGLPADRAGLRAHFVASLAGRVPGQGGSPDAAARFVEELRDEVRRCGGDYYEAYLRQAPETRAVIRERHTPIGT